MGIVIAVILLLTAVYCMRAASVPFAMESYSIQSLEGWTLVSPEMETERNTVSLPVKLNVGVNEEALLRACLPQAFSEVQTICFWSQSQDVRVSVNGVLVYQWVNIDHKELTTGTPSVWNLVALPADSAGKTIEISYSSPYTYASGRFQQVYYGDEFAVDQWLIQHFRFNTILDLFIFFTGVIIIGIAFVAEQAFSTYWQRKLYLGLFAVLVSVWLRLGVVGTPLKLAGPYLQECLAWFSFLFMAIPLIAYIRCRVGGTWKKLFSILLAVYLGFGLIALALQCTRIVDIELLLPGMIGLIICFVVLILVFCIRCFFGFPFHYTLLDVIGVETIVIVAVLEMVAFCSADGIASMGVWIRSGMLPYVTGEGIYEIYRGRKRRKEMQRMEIENNRLQLQLLLEQIEPHFIYNALGAIRELIRDDPNEAYHALYDFSKYLRQHIGVCDAMSLIDFSTELDNIQTYLSLEKVRFEDLLSVRYDIAFVDFQVPPLTIQPFVENAVKHGIFQKEDGGTIILSVHRDSETIYIDICDDGAGFDVEETMRRIDLTNASYGMKNAMRRLKKLRDADCRIESVPAIGTKVHITMPLVQFTSGGGSEEAPG